MKIAICTLVGYFNYGNRLQNYALQEIMKKRGCEVQTIKYEDKVITKKNYIQSLFRLLNDKALLKKIKEKINKKKIDEIKNRRILSFIDFTTRYISESKFIIDLSDVNYQALEEFDAFVIGSDQVWNYSFPSFCEYFFLPYADKFTFSYAASFGVDAIPENYKDIYRRGLSSVDMISVREYEGKQLVETLINTKSLVVLDPTLMLEKKEWLKLCKDKKKYSKSYILTYFLDKPSKDTENYYEKIAKEHEFEIKKLADISDEELWVADPAEFINLFSQAEAVFTDSFHACVFSIIFEKYFEVFERNTKLPSMNSRIDTLFELLNLKDRWHDANIGIKVVNYNDAHRRLEVVRKSSFEFLEEALQKAKESLKNNE